MTVEIDTRGLSCPQPVLMFMSAMKKDPAAEFDVLVDTDASRENVTRAASNHGFHVEQTQEDDDTVRLKLRKA